MEDASEMGRLHVTLGERVCMFSFLLVKWDSVHFRASHYFLVKINVASFF